jgi:hypothetical protein
MIIDCNFNYLMNETGTTTHADTRTRLIVLQPPHGT